MPKKILEIKAEDWEKALSYDAETFNKGIFKVFSNCNPFYRKGNFQPVAAATQLGSGTINVNKVIRVILPVYTGGVPQFYVWADDAKVYLTDGASLSDKSSSITSNTYTMREAIVWQGKIVYITDTIAYSNPIPLSSDTTVLSGLTTGPHPACIGADRYLYIGNQNNVAKLVISTGTAGNTTSVAASLESGYVVKKLINDGRYLVWIADNSTAQANFGQKNSCIVAFWDLAKSVFDQIYEFQDSYIEGAEIVGDTIKVITPSGIYHTNNATRPQLVVPFGSTILQTEGPVDFHATTVFQQNFLMWGSSLASGNSKVVAYGNKIYGQPPRLFQQFTATSNPVSAIGTDNNLVLIGVGASASVKLWALNSTSVETSVATLAGVSLDRPYVYHHSRITTRSPISGGDSVSLAVLNAAGTKTISASSTKTNSLDSGEKNLIFDPVAAGDGSDVKAFDEISDIQITTNVAIKHFELWAEPADERSSYA